MWIQIRDGEKSAFPLIATFFGVLAFGLIVTLGCALDAAAGDEESHLQVPRLGQEAFPSPADSRGIPQLAVLGSTSRTAPGADSKEIGHHDSSPEVIARDLPWPRSGRAARNSHQSVMDATQDERKVEGPVFAVLSYEQATSESIAASSATALIATKTAPYYGVLLRLPNEPVFRPNIDHKPNGR